MVEQCLAACPGNVRCVERYELGHAAIGLKEGAKGSFKHSEAGVVGRRMYNMGAAPVAQRRGLRGIHLRNEPLAESGHVLHGHGADVASARVIFVVIPVVWQQVAHSGPQRAPGHTHFRCNCEGCGQTPTRKIGQFQAESINGVGK